MTRIVLISCVSQKLPHKAKTKYLYVSDLFKKSLKYAESLNPDQIFVLSAQYKLVTLHEEIEPYDQTLNDMSAEERREWAARVIGQLREVTDLDQDEFIFLAGQKYREYLTPHIRNYRVPLEGLRIGQQKRYLKRMVSDE